MDNDREDQIRKLAYEIWAREARTGDPEGRWVRAERELRAKSSGGGGIAVDDALSDNATAAADQRSASCTVRPTHGVTTRCGYDMDRLMRVS